jgi:hypothetical protein
MKVTTIAIASGLFACTLALPSGAARARELTLEDRIEYQRRIESVLWSHTLWPEQNPTPKPALSAVVSDADVRRKVETALAESVALERYWQRPIETAQLQAELDRMAEGSQQPEVLLELFAALDDDPDVIAEALARPALADRLIRSWYARDPRFHGALRAAAEAALRTGRDVAAMRRLGAEYSETEVVATGSPAALQLAEPIAGRLELDASAWTALVREVAVGFALARPGTSDSRAGRARETLDVSALLDRIPLGRAGALQETDDSFLVYAVTEKSPGRLHVATVRWPKKSFDTWWTEVRGSLPAFTESNAPATSERDAGLAVPAVTAATCTADTWTPSKIEVPDPRSNEVAVWTGTQMVIWSGFDGMYMSTGGRYTPATDTWTTVTTSGAPPPRTGAVAAWTGTEMIVWGGTNAAGSNSSYLNSGGRYNPTSNTWTATSTGANVPSGRTDSAGIWSGTELIVWGGYDGNLNAFYNTGGRYNPSTDSWVATSTGTNLPAARYGHTAVWSTTTSEMIVWGGQDSTFTPVNTGGRYKPATDTWTATPTTGAVPTAVAKHSAVWTGSEMIVWGGTPDFLSDTNAGGRYNPSTNAWTATPSSGAPGARQSHVAVWTGSVMIVWGGESSVDGSVFNTGGRFTPSSNSWASTSTGANVPAARSGSAAVWSGTEMIVWGGYDASSPVFQMNTGGRYNPGTDSWVPTTNGSTVPVARSQHTTVFSGTEMIVWGGDGGIRGLLNSGGRYTPSTDTWVPTSTGTNVPAARSYATAVWSGTTMVVWGGYNGSTVLNSGGRYTPSTNSWATTSTSGSVPSARNKHTAVWTGSRMIVWGGMSGSGTQFNTGGQYDPASDTWTATSTGANVPLARFYHSAVWTGTEMIVWGGSSGSAFLNTGGHYNPTTDSWIATSTGANVPAIRIEHSATWTGSEMMIWGGYTPPYTNTGARYNPATQTWTPVSTGANVPSARSGHQAIWMGNRVIVWGGYNGSYMNSGALYNPADDTWSAMTTNSVPAARRYFTAINGGASDGRMIVWGGEPVTSTGGLYCVTCGLIWYQDLDGDGHGNPNVSQPACTAPTGYVSAGDDCNDADPTVIEVPPEVTGLKISKLSGTTAELSWDSQAAISGSSTKTDVVTGFLDALRSAHGFGGATCLASQVTGTVYDDTRANPGAGLAYYYLVRGTTSCGKGTYGDSGQVPDPRDALDSSGPCP